MEKLIAFGVGYWLGERRGGEASRAPGGGASGWLTAFLILIGILAFGNVKFDPPASRHHAATVHSSQTGDCSPRC